MKKFLFLIFLAAFAAAPAFATWSYDGADGGNYWITDGTWRIKIAKNGSTYYVGGWSGGGPTLDLSTAAADLAAEPTPHTLTFSSIGGNAFQNNTTLVTLVLPDFCTTISGNSFNGCKALQTAIMPGVTTFSGAQAFAGCTSLVTVDCPNLKAINGYGAFSGCTSLKELKVAPNMTSFSTDTVRSCTSFTTLYTNEATKVEGHVQLPPGVTYLGNYNFYQTKITHVFAPGVTSLNSGNGNTFASCTLLKEVHLPSLTSLAAPSAFNGSAVLETIEVSPGLAGTIANSAFSGCKALESIYQSGDEPVYGLVDLPAGVTKLEWASFYDCKAIVNVVAPGVTEIRNRAFQGCTVLRTAEFSPALSVLHDDGNYGRGTFTDCAALVHFFPSTIPNITELRMSVFRGCSSLTNAFDFSGATLSNVTGSHFFNGASKVSCVRLPASFPKLYEKEFYNMAPGAEIHFAGNIPSKDSKNDQMYAGKNGAGNRYKIFVDAGTHPAWTNGTVSGATFTPKTLAMELESDYPGVATLGYLNYASSGQNNWLVQEPFYVDATFYDDDGTTVIGVERTLLGAAPAWTGPTPAKASTAQDDYEFAGWSTDGSTIVDLSTLRAAAPMSFRAVYAPVLRSYAIEWQWFDGTATQTETATLNYGETPAHAPVERAATAEHTYTFLGWSTDGSTVLDPIPSVTGSTTFIAVFEEKEAAATVTVRWMDDDGTTVLGTTWPDKGAAAVAPVAPTKDSTAAESYAFAGWSTDGATVLSDLTVNADTDFIAVYTVSVRQYPVVFKDWDDRVLLSTNLAWQTTAADVEAARPADPFRAATAEYTYAFAGWAPAFAVVTTNAVYVAEYTAEANIYAATFVDGVDGSTILGPTNYAYGAAVEAPEPPEHYGFTFSAWSPAVAAMPAADTVYTAVYSTNRYTITWNNGDAPTTAKYDYLTPTNAIAVPGGSKASTSKYYYKFRGWTPALEPVQSNTTYTATFDVLVGRPMVLALADVTVADGHTAFTVTATLSDFSSSEAAPTAAVSGAFHSQYGRIGDAFDGTAAVSAGSVTATLSGLDADGGYDWEIVATQDVMGNPDADRTVLRGRSYAKRHKGWFAAGDVVWTDGAFAPAALSEDRQQVRVRSVLAVPDIPPRVHANATGWLVGIEAFESSCGDGVAWCGWDGAKWIRLKGAVPPCGGTATILTVVDFAMRTPTVSWYADGRQLTTEDGEWAVPLAGGTRLASFADEAGIVSSLWADYDLGAPSTVMIFR